MPYLYVSERLKINHRRQIAPCCPTLATARASLVMRSKPSPLGPGRGRNADIQPVLQAVLWIIRLVLSRFFEPMLALDLPCCQWPPEHGARSILNGAWARQRLSASPYSQLLMSCLGDSTWLNQCHTSPTLHKPLARAVTRTRGGSNELMQHDPGKLKDIQKERHGPLLCCQS